VDPIGDTSPNGLDPEHAHTPEQIARNLRGVADVRDALRRPP
jgi:hypothetical protein